MHDPTEMGIGPASLALIRAAGGEAALRALGERSTRPDPGAAEPAPTAAGIDARLAPLAEAGALVKLLEPEYVDQRFVYDRAVSRLGELGLDAVPLLVESLGAPESSVARGAAAALGAMGEPAMPALLWALRWGNARVRGHTVRAFAELLRVPAPDTGMLTRLARLLAEDDAEEVRIAAIEALAGNDHPVAVEALRRAAAGPGTTLVTVFARAALERLGTPAAQRALDDVRRDRAPVGAPSSPTRVPRVFLSYAREDASTMAEYRRRLEISGFDVWTDSQRLVAGEDWDERLRFAIHSSDFVVALLSDASWDGYQRVEVAEALDRHRRSEGPFLLPVFLSAEAWRAPSTDRPPDLADLHVIIADDDARGWAALYQDLSSASRTLGLELPPRLRSEPRSDLIERDVFAFLVAKNLYSNDHNPRGEPLGDEWEITADGSLAVDVATGLAWTRTPVMASADHVAARRFAAAFVSTAPAYASADFRLPTVEEAMSLMRPARNDEGLHLPPQLSGGNYLLTADTAPAPPEPWFPATAMVWVADFTTTGVHPMPANSAWPVRLVTSTPARSTF